MDTCGSESVKLKLTSTLRLALPCLKETFILHTYTSQSAMGAVLAQMQDSKERAICFASKWHSNSQTKYSATRREVLAFVTLICHFRHYLHGQIFTIVTNYSELQLLHSSKDADVVTARWLEKFADSDYEVRHWPKNAKSPVLQMGCRAFPRTQSMQLEVAFLHSSFRMNFHN